MIGSMAADFVPQSAPSARRRETLTRLLDAALEVFAEDGLQGAAVETICTRAGFTRGAFYSNFSSKEQLFIALLERELVRRTEDLQQKVIALEPTLLAHEGDISPAEAARYIADFVAPSDEAVSWFILETEFLLLAMRDPSLAPEHHKFLDSFYENIAAVVERVILAAGRRFELPVARVIPVLGGVFERSLRNAAFRGVSKEQADGDYDQQLAELFFALTVPIDDQPTQTS